MGSRKLSITAETIGEAAASFSWTLPNCFRFNLNFVLLDVTRLDKYKATLNIQNPKDLMLKLRLSWNERRTKIKTY